jgi:predicted phage terminase large subunit-like protein
MDGQVTGQGAGRIGSQLFSGAILIDDPAKPKDADSRKMLDKVIQRYHDTVKSRVASMRDTPIIVCAQRTAKNDLCGHMLSGGTGEKWHHLNIPVNVDKPITNDSWTHAIPVDHGLPKGPLWELRHNREDIAILKLNKYVYECQYNGNPQTPEGKVYRLEHFQRYHHFDPVNNLIYLDDSGQNPIQIMEKRSYADTGFETKKINSRSSVQLWGRGNDGRIYKLDNLTDWWEAPDLETNYIAFHDRHKFRTGINNMGVARRFVENKASGIGLIQSINKAMKVHNWIEGIPRDTDKLARFRSGTPSIARGLVVLPYRASWLQDFEAEIQDISNDGSHDHDDQAEPMTDAIHDMLLDDSGFDYRRLVA